MKKNFFAITSAVFGAMAVIAAFFISHRFMEIQKPAIPKPDQFVFVPIARSPKIIEIENSKPQARPPELMPFDQKMRLLGNPPPPNVDLIDTRPEPLRAIDLRDNQ